MWGLEVKWTKASPENKVTPVNRCLKINKMKTRDLTTGVSHVEDMTQLTRIVF